MAQSVIRKSSNNVLYANKTWALTHEVTIPNVDAMYIIVGASGDMVTALAYANGTGGRIGAVGDLVYIDSVTINNYKMTITMKSQASVSVIRVI